MADRGLGRRRVEEVPLSRSPSVRSTRTRSETGTVARLEKIHKNEFFQPPPSVTSAETPHPLVPLPNGHFAEVGEVLRAPFGQDYLWIHQPAANPFNMGIAEQAITLLHLRLLFFNKTSCSEKVMLEVFQTVNLCQSFLKMP